MKSDSPPPHIVFAVCLATELDMDITPAFIAASDRVLMRLWMEGFKITPLKEEDYHGEPAMGET